MTRTKKKNLKTDIINIRINAKEKQQFMMEAKQYGMTFSEYVLHILRHKQLNVIEGGRELAEALYHCHLGIDQQNGEKKEDRHDDVTDAVKKLLKNNS